MSHKKKLILFTRALIYGLVKEMSTYRREMIRAVRDFCEMIGAFVEALDER